MIKEADHQGGRVIHPTAFPTFLKMYRNLHVVTKPMRIFVCESEINHYYYIINVNSQCKFQMHRLIATNTVAACSKNGYLYIYLLC